MKKFEEKQLKHLKKQRQKQPYRGYLAVFTITIILTRVINELSSNISTYIQSSVVSEFFVSSGYTYEEGLSRFTFINMLVSCLVMLVVFYKPLADKLGRKVILCINTIGILCGMLFCFTSVNIWMYCAGVAFYTFFLQNDLQMIFILETAPQDKGARLFGIIKSIGILGLVLVPVLRDTVMGNDAARWRNLFIGPILLCIAAILMLFLFVRESRLFLDTRIADLETPLSKREKTQAAEDSGVKPGLVQSIRYIFSHGDLKICIIAYTFYGACSMAAYMYVESIMTTNGMSAQDVTKALYVYPFVYAALSYSAGFIADRFGRKRVVVTAGLFVAVGYVFFVVGCAHGWNPYLIGFINGIYLGGYWVCGDYISVMFTEKVPTSLRASVMSGAYVLMIGGCFLGVAAEMMLMMKIGLNLAGILTIVPCISLCTALILFRVRETRGTNLRSIRKEE